MKKLLLPLLLFTCLAANAAIPGITNYFSQFGAFQPWDDGKETIYWEVSECEPNQLQIDFEIADAYIYPVTQTHKFINSSPSSITIEVFDVWGEQLIEVRNSSGTHSFVTFNYNQFQMIYSL